MRMNLPQRIMPKKICKIPMSTTVANRYSTPCVTTRDTITTASAPVAPEIMPGRPPKTAVMMPTMKAAERPTRGSTCATNEKATAHGNSARATVRPESNSTLTVLAEKPDLAGASASVDECKEHLQWGCQICFEYWANPRHAL